MPNPRMRQPSPKRGDSQPARLAAAEVEAIKRKEEVAAGTPAMERFAHVLADLRGREPDWMWEDPQTVNHQPIDMDDPINWTTRSRG